MLQYIKHFFTETSKNAYALPIPTNTKISNILYDWPSHEGPFKGAVDFAVALETPVVAPFEGTIVEIVDTHDKHGPSAEFADYLNYITIKHANNEYSQLAHIAKGTARISVGEQVKTGQQLAVTGLNGWMEEPFLEHVHMLVFKLLPNGGFQGVQIRWQTKPRVAPL